jgi:hypothetical protein
VGHELIEPKGVQPVKSKLWLVGCCNISMVVGSVVSSVPNPMAGVEVCQTQKPRFSCTEPDKPGSVHHVYECTKCRSTQSLSPRSSVYVFSRNIHF